MSGKEQVGDGSKIKPVLTEIFELMDDNNDKKIDQDEGIAVTNRPSTHVDREKP